MATNKKAASKPAKTTSAKKAAAKTPAKKVAPAKAVKKVVAAAAKKAVAKPIKKTAPAKTVAKAKQATPVKKNVPVKNKKTVNKKTSKPVAKAAAKKAAPAKKAPAKKAAPVKVAAKKAAPAKKVAAKKAAPAKKAAAKKIVPAKKAAPVKKAAPAKQAVVKAAPVKKAAAPKPAPAPKNLKAKPKKGAKTIIEPAKKAAVAGKAPIPKPSAAIAPNASARTAVTRSAIRDEKKTNVIIAHRRLENKSHDKDIAGKTMINYQPDYTRSILDKPVEQSGPVYRYSDDELNEFKDLINNRIEAARKELAYLQGLITRKDEAGTEDTENRYMNMEDGSGAMEREQLAQLASRQIQFIGHLEKALMRIESKTYGICRVTGKLIDKARLRAVPHATLSIEAKKTMSKQ